MKKSQPSKSKEVEIITSQIKKKDGSKCDVPSKNIPKTEKIYIKYALY